VRTQIRSILRKLQVRSQLEAVALDFRTGWCVASVAPAPRPQSVGAHRGAAGPALERATA
jgi:hypothetical protein